MASLVEDDVFVPPVGAITPQRHYFLFGRPISTAEIDPRDEQAVAAAYAELRSRVTGGLRVLQEELRPKDTFRELLPRSAWESLYDTQAPGPVGYTDE